MRKATMATVKSFIRKNADSLHILTKSSFDGMTDGCESTGQKEFSPVKKSEQFFKNNLGIAGAWFVGSSRDSIVPFDANGYTGFSIYNCCGSFTLAVKSI